MLTEIGPTEIIPDLYIGSIYDAIYDKTKWHLIICVAEWSNFSDEECYDLMVQGRPITHVPFMVYKLNSEWADTGKLELISELIHLGLQRGKVLVHCCAGCERSPLAVVYHLQRQGLAPSFEDAYEFIQAKRPMVANRLEWLRSESYYIQSKCLDGRIRCDNCGHALNEVVHGVCEFVDEEGGGRCDCNSYIPMHDDE